MTKEDMARVADEYANNDKTQVQCGAGRFLSREVRTAPTRIQDKRNTGKRSDSRGGVADEMRCKRTVSDATADT